MKLRRFLMIMLAATLVVGTTANADDGAITNKSMSQNIQLPDFGQDIVNSAVPEAEHAFTDMMGFYVPAQAASGEVGPIPYCDVDNKPASGQDCPEGSEVEKLEVAKPLVNVFVYGPSFHVPNTAFAHRWFDTYAAVSLDDGETWKKTNLSESADRSSFNLETDHILSGPGSGDPLPGDHNIKLGNAFHAKGYETPYTAHCSECHGQGLQGVAQVPSCYSCHENKWEEATPIEIGPIVYMAEVKGKANKSKLKIKGENAADSVEVTIVNAITGHPVGTTEAEDDGKFEFEEKFKRVLPPCVVFAEYTDNSGEVFTGPSLSVINKQTGEPIENCEGTPVNLTEYPGGTYNVFQATAGNKTLVAWPSRFCSSGQPAYSMTADNADQAQEDRLGAVVSFIQSGDAELGVSALSGFDMDNDLYLKDAFGVAGNQGSIDFADEGYPQAGVVPFGCVWTARGVLLPGDDPRTEEVEEESHMVWTKAERLTSGRRDPNRIEVQAVKGAGFVVTWQEDPEGLRPGQGEGPGEGWSGAVAHSQTDIWYSFINEEYFDIVETVDNTLVPIDILEHDLSLSGRPQAFVPMAVPMRLSNNAKCNPEGKETSGEGDEDLYCTAEATTYGLKDQCADTVTIQTGNVDSTYGLTASEICVNEDGLPNRANTAATRPRTSLQGYNVTDTKKSAWVIVAAEESKGLGKYFFTPDSLLSTDTPGDADPCDEEDNTCTAEIGKNQWYYSFDMGTPDTFNSEDTNNPDSLVNNLVSQGNMLNQPEVYWETGEFYGLMSTADMEDYISDEGTDYNFDIINTEIARRSSLLVQSLGKATDSANGLLAISSWKQGTMRQGGPADTMMRRIVLANTNSSLIPAEVPCAVQAKDQGESNWGPWLPVSNAPEGCSGAIPEDCVYPNTATSGCSGIIVRNDDGPTITKARVNANGKLRIEGINADDNLSTKVVIRNAVTKDTLGRGKHDTGGNFLFWLNLNDDIDPLVGVGNPYAFRNMVCDDYLIEADSNPYYPDGVCADSAINLSSVVPDVCFDDSGEGDDECPSVDYSTSTFGIGTTNPILKGIKDDDGTALSNTQRVLSWHQCPSAGSQISGGAEVLTCTDEEYNLTDQSWYNPLDISKGHRGFLDGDFVMFLYAWSPTWRLNAKGKDRYELYVRRSFDGGNSWTTTPSSFKGSDGFTYSGDGTVTCESYRTDDTGTGEPSEPKACFDFAAGAAEHARNVTQHKSMRITTLDPRYAATKATITDGCTDGLFLDSSLIEDIFTCDDGSLTDNDITDSDLRDASRYFMVFETGDNTTVEVGEAEPLDLNYSQAVNFGDDYVVWTELDTESANPEDCYPTVSSGVDVGDGIEGSGFCNEFDRMNTRGDTHSSEGDLEANSDGSKLYGVWTQWVFDESGEEIEESDAMARRVWWLDNFIPDDSYTLPGTNSSSDN